MDLGAIIGVFFGIVCILIGQALEGGNIGQLIQITAAFIVFGGTAGAVIMSFPVPTMKDAMLIVSDIFAGPKVNFDETIDEIIQYAQKARKEGVISLEKDAKNANDSLLRFGLELIADGTDPTLVQSMMENQLAQLEAKVNGAAKVWESAGGFSPTIGIIGAVLGLIQVMQNLSDPSKLGAGIAVAFVATVYGVGSANLIFIPFSTRLKFKYQKVFILKELIIEGIMAIQAGESPALIERKLNSFILDSHLRENNETKA